MTITAWESLISSVCFNTLAAQSKHHITLQPLQMKKHLIHKPLNQNLQNLSIVMYIR